MELKPAKGINIKDYNPADILNGKRWRMTEKIDGVRRLFYKSKTGSVYAYSNTLKKDKWLSHITSFLESPWYPLDMVYDCELVDRALYLSRVDSFLLRAETTGKASQQYPDNKKDLMAICFDMFRPDGDMTSGIHRTDLLFKTFPFVRMNDPIVLVPYLGYLDGYDESTLDYLMSLILKRNGEGIMLMNLDTPYIGGRTKELVKIKRLEEFNGVVIDYELAKHDTKIYGGVSALICKVNGCTVPVRVGSGLNNDIRKAFAISPPIGKTIEIDAFGRSKISMVIFL